MDNLCHSLVGMALSRAGLNKRTALATSTLVIANNLPDIDVARVRDQHAGDVVPPRLDARRARATDAADRAHRRDAALRSLLPKEGLARPIAPTPGQILLLSYLGVLLHVFMDFTNSYGVRLLMPFSERWFYGDALYIVDPWLYLMLGLGWWLAKHQPRPARIGVALAAIYVVGDAALERDRAPRSRGRAGARGPAPRRASW